MDALKWNAMESIDFIFKRRSIRKFTAEPVSPSHQETLLKAAMAAPSAMNCQSWEFVVVDDPEVLKEVRRISPFGNHNAPLAVIVLGSPQKVLNPVGAQFWVEDCSAAMENMLLAAACLGLGGVWVGVHPINAIVSKARAVLNIPRASTPLGIAFIGHPAEEKPASTKYKEKKVHWQRYGGERLEESHS